MEWGVWGVVFVIFGLLDDFEEEFVVEGLVVELKKIFFFVGVVENV